MSKVKRRLEKINDAMEDIEFILDQVDFKVTKIKKIVIKLLEQY